MSTRVPNRGPTTEESLAVGTFVAIPELEQRVHRRIKRSMEPRPPPRPPARWEGSPRAAPSARAALFFDSPRSSRQWTPIMQRDAHLDSWTPKAATTTRRIAELADVSDHNHAKPVGDPNTRRVKAHAALLRNIRREAEAAAAGPPDPAAQRRFRETRREERAAQDRWTMRPASPRAAAAAAETSISDRELEAEHSLTHRELAASWARGEQHPSSSAGWSQGFAAAARGSTHIYAHRTLASGRRAAHPARTSSRSGSGSSVASSWGMPTAAHPPADGVMSPGTQAEQIALQKLLEQDLGQLL